MTKHSQRTTPDGPVSRDVVLALAERARRSENTPLRDLLPMVAGMLAADGRVVGDQWREMCRLSGSYGIGLMLSKRHEYQAVQEQARGGMAALDARVRTQAHGWSYATVGEIGLGDEFTELMDALVITTVGELVAFIKDRGPEWAEQSIVLGVERGLDRFRETFPPEQQAAFDKARKPDEPKEKPARKKKEPRAAS